MKQELNSKFWCLSQNNSGDFIFHDENVAEFVWIEALDINDFQERANKILEEYRYFCECCGERWDDDIKQEKDGEDKPHEVKNCFGRLCDVPVHFIDGSISKTSSLNWGKL